MSEPTIDLDFRLDGRVALVTGGASGIGAAIAAAFAAKGARIAVVDLNESGALDAAAALGDDSRGFRCDVADPESVTATVDAVAEHARPHRHPRQQRRDRHVGARRRTVT